MNYLLDTAAWANAVTRPAAMPERIHKLMASGNLGLASVSLLETATLHRLGRLDWGAGLDAFYREAISERITLLEITPAIAAATNDLSPAFQLDPFDRAIAATARLLDLVLITPDRKIRDANCCRVEFYRFRRRR